MIMAERIGRDPMVVLSDPRPAMLRAATLLSWIVVALMAASGILVIAVRDLLAAESTWGKEAFRGGELVTLFVAAPLLAGALIEVGRGSVRGQAVWIGMLLYGVYNAAYAVFGTTFNDAFLVHIATMSASGFALACALPALDYRRIAGAFGCLRGARAIGVFLVVVGIAQGALWLFLLVRNAITGEILHDIPVAGQHLVFALDLGFLVPTLILSGVLLARRRPFGFLLGSAAAVMGAVYQVNLMTAGVFQANAEVPGVKAFAPEGLVLTLAFTIAALASLIGVTDTSERSEVS